MKAIKLLKNKGLTIFLVLIFFGILAYNITVRNLQTQINRERKEIINQGETFSLSNSRPLPIPRDTNAAPFYEAAMDLLDYGYGGTAAFSEPEKVLKYIEENREKTRSEVETNKRIYGLLREAFEKPDCRFKLRYHQGFEMDVPNYLAFRVTEQYLAQKAFIEILDNEPEKAVETCATGLKFSRDIVEGVSFKNRRPSLIAVMIGIAGKHIIIAPLEVMVKKGIRTDYTPVILQIDKSLEESEGEIIRSFKTERILSIDLFDKVINNVTSISKVIDGWVGEKRFWTSVKYRWGLKLFILKDKLYYLRHIKRVIKALKDNNISELESLGKEVKQIEYKYLLSGMLIPHATRAKEQSNKTRKQFMELREKLEALNTAGEKEAGEKEIQ